MKVWVLLLLLVTTTFLSCSSVPKKQKCPTHTEVVYVYPPELTVPEFTYEKLDSTDSLCSYHNQELLEHIITNMASEIRTLRSTIKEYNRLLKKLKYGGKHAKNSMATHN